MFYELYIFNRLCACVFHTKWNEAPKADGPPDAADPARTAAPRQLAFEEQAKLVYGVVFSLRNIVNKLTPPEDAAAADGGVALAVPHGEMLAFRTSAYKLHYFATASGLKFVLLTDPQMDTGAAREALRGVYEHVYVATVSKNPFAAPDSAVTNALFRTTLERYVTALPGFAG